MRDTELKEFLVSFGWNEAEVRGEAGGAVVDLERVGFVSHPEARSFLAAYYGLKIDHPPTTVIEGKMISSWTSFDPTAVCTARDADVARRCAEVADAVLFPVGVDSFHVTLYSGNDGKFYAGFDSSVYQYGEDRNEMFSMIKNGDRPILLGEWLMQ
ncbi:SUKH-3 domain-containing protein [Lentzea sp. NBC_00516]|uniref:SUKH-3 domain-containing protein n=1 Tax=Lentzea sp. NBC_00516 TaxID=2903582 RepID=UPI002E801A11|nr:SUKH-3 domain-containing protein [Lentzea sp. NBC_00516]WUD29310.1 SUKH-3 domain-containing protein [Lentzea sp. NBC_00516]